MQRLAAQFTKAAVPAGLVAAGVQRATPITQPPHGASSGAREGETTRMAMEESDGFVHIGLQAQPVQQHEVSQAISQLAALGGVTVEQRPTSPITADPLPAGARMSGGPIIEEIDSESDASSEGSAANLLMAAGELAYESYGYGRGAAAAAEELSSLELLSSAVTSILNDESVMRAIEGRLMQDPAFVQLVNRASPGMLPAPARALYLEELSASTSGSECEYDVSAERAAPGGNPLLGLLAGIQRGVAAAAVNVGMAFCHLGNYIRGLGESLRIALAGMDPAASGGPDGAPRPRAIELAILKVACVVAVMVITRRVVAVPMRMAV